MNLPLHRLTPVMFALLAHPASAAILISQHSEDSFVRDGTDAAINQSGTRPRQL